MGAPGTTPGKWRADAINGWNVWSDDCKIAVTQNVNQAEQYRVPDPAERIANAHQIAASGDLYDALEALVRDVMEGDDVSAFQIAKHAGLAALALARGENAHV